MAHVFCSRQQRRWLAGVQGAAMSPLVAGTMPAKSWHGSLRAVSRCRTLWGCTRLFGFRPDAAGRPSHLVRRVVHSFWPSCVRVASAADKPSYELTRLVPCVLASRRGGDFRARFTRMLGPSRLPPGV